MAKDLSSSRSNTGVPERPFFDRLVELEREKERVTEDIKQVCIDAKEADVRVMPLKKAVKRHLETEEKRLARENLEEEVERLLRALGALADSPLGEAAINRRKNKAENPQ